MRLFFFSKKINKEEQEPIKKKKKKSKSFNLPLIQDPDDFYFIPKGLQKCPIASTPANCTTGKILYGSSAAPKYVYLSS